MLIKNGKFSRVIFLGGYYLCRRKIKTQRPPVGFRSLKGLCTDNPLIIIINPVAIFLPPLVTEFCVHSVNKVEMKQKNVGS